MYILVVYLPYLCSTYIWTRRRRVKIRLPARRRTTIRVAIYTSHTVNPSGRSQSVPSRRRRLARTDPVRLQRQASMTTFSPLVERNLVHLLYFSQLDEGDESHVRAIIQLNSSLCLAIAEIAYNVLYSEACDNVCRKFRADLSPFKTRLVSLCREKSKRARTAKVRSLSPRTVVALSRVVRHLTYDGFQTASDERESVSRSDEHGQEGDDGDGGDGAGSSDRSRAGD